MNRLVVFARAPRRGRVKRRLAAAIGEDAALAFYSETLFDLLARVGTAPRWQTWLAVTPDARDADGSLWPAGIPRQPQGPDDLGARMYRALAAPPAGPVMLIGSDIPAIGRQHLAAAFDALERHDFVFGPAPDGGFWLVGAARRAPLPERLFAGTCWSTEHALADSLAGLPRGAGVTLIDQLEDVDDAHAYARWRQARAMRRARCLSSS
jgi:rSAM/selenodomain-associated transferase 1